MKIGLIDVDGHHFPNLALMKLSSYHKSKSDSVEFAQIGYYDRTYVSKVFTFTEMSMSGIGSWGEVIKGGTGFCMTNTLPKEVEHIMPDYSLYNVKEAYGFLTRGCPNNCPWCVVPRKEGNIVANADIEEFWSGQSDAILLDNNVLAHEHGLKQIEKIIRLGIRVDFNQGLDARIVAADKEIAHLLSRLKWIRQLRFACDTKAQIPYVEKALDNLNKYGFKNHRVFVYVLVKDIADAMHRVLFLKNKGCDPFAQPYRDFENNIQPTKEQKDFARWVNHKAIFNSVCYDNYKR